MRLWHQKILSKLPRQQLLGQHRECCALRGLGWGRNHSTVNYVFDHMPEMLVAYHYLVMDEMKRRGYHPNEIWYDCDYRGSSLKKVYGYCDTNSVLGFVVGANRCGIMIYPEHNDKYLQECIENLSQKGVDISEFSKI